MERIRSTSDFATARTATLHETLTTRSGTGCTGSTESSNEWTWNYCPSSYEKEIIDVNTPNFHARMKRGEIINNPLSIITTVASETPRNITQSFGQYDDGSNCGYHYIQYGQRAASAKLGSATDPDSYLAQPDINVESLKSQAVMQAHANIEQSKAMILSTLGEAEETIRFIASTLARLVKIYKAIRRLDVRALKGELSPKELADRYMEYRYAIRPMIFDVSNMLEAIASMKSDSPRRQTYRSRKVESDNNSIGVTDWPTTSNWIQYSYTASTHREVIASAGILTDIEIVSNLNIWGLDSIVESAWDLTPFSFIVDWFFNVGTTLAAWTPEAGVKDLASWVTVEDTVTSVKTLVSARPLGDPDHDYESVSESGGSIHLMRKSYTRTPNPSRSIFPSFTLNLNALKLLDLAIILKKIMAS